MQNETIKISIVHQIFAKAFLFIIAVTICMDIFSEKNIPLFENEWKSIELITGVFLLIISLTLIQYVFLTPIIIKDLSFILRCTFTISASVITVLLVCLCLNWFTFGVSQLVIFSLIFSFIFVMSVLLIRRFQSNNVEINFKKTLIALFAAFTVGLAAGFRGKQELQKPWNMPVITITELDDFEDKHCDIN